MKVAPKTQKQGAKTYFAITFYADGDSSLISYTEEELQVELEAGYLTNVAFLGFLPEHETEFTDGDDVLLIKGEVIIPRLIAGTQKYELPKRGKSIKN